MPEHVYQGDFYIMKKRLFAGLLFGILFGGFTYLVKTYDVAAIGPEGTEVGFSRINQFVHNFTGVNMNWYESTELLGYAAIGVAALFALAGLFQWIKRKSLFKVDREIIGLGVLFVIVIGLYFAFEKVIINYRPVIMPGETHPEASFPSSHTMLIITVMGAAMMLLGRYIRNGFLKTLIWLIFLAAIIVTIGGRLYSGVHWCSDIVAGILLSLTLIEFYGAFISGGKKNGNKKDKKEESYMPRH